MLDSMMGRSHLIHTMTVSHPNHHVIVNDRLQSGYVYEIVVMPGSNFATNFSPAFTPKEMLALGVFEGKYCNDCRGELPVEWFKGARISDVSDPTLNRCKVTADSH